MSWLGVAPLKKFPAPVRKSIALQTYRLEAAHMLTNSQSSRWPPSSLPVRDHADLELYFLLELPGSPLLGTDRGAHRLETKERGTDWR